jgi:hypothetical protein
LYCLLDPLRPCPIGIATQLATTPSWCGLDIRYEPELCSANDSEKETDVTIRNTSLIAELSLIGVLCLTMLACCTVPALADGPSLSLLAHAQELTAKGDAAAAISILEPLVQSGFVLETW